LYIHSDKSVCSKMELTTSDSKVCENKFTVLKF